MARPADGYRLKDGTKIPGTTTITGRFGDKGGLIRWAYQQGKDGKELYEERDTAADIGTCVHGMVESHINGKTADECRAIPDTILATPDMRDKALSGFAAYLAWAANFKFEITHQEVPLVSELYKVGGTPDGIAMINGKRVILDWKTSKKIYSDYLVQIAAYKLIWEENFPDLPIDGGFHLLRFAKEHGDFSHQYYANLDEGARAFVLSRELFEIDKILKKRAP